MRCCGRLASSLTGLWSEAAHKLLSMRLNSSTKSVFQHQNKLRVISSRAFKASGNAGKTIKLLTFGIFTSLIKEHKYTTAYAVTRYALICTFTTYIVIN